MDINSIVADAAASVFLALLTVIGGYVVAYLQKHVGAKRLAVASDIARAAVAAVEQVAVARGWKSADKYESALMRCRDLSARAGVSFTDSQWTTLIERGVAELKQLGAELSPAPGPVASLGARDLTAALSGPSLSTPLRPA